METIGILTAILPLRVAQVVARQAKVSRRRFGDANHPIANHPVAMIRLVAYGVQSSNRTVTQKAIVPGFIVRLGSR